MTTTPQLHNPERDGHRLALFLELSYDYMSCVDLLALQGNVVEIPRPVRLSRGLAEREVMLALLRKFAIGDRDKDPVRIDKIIGVIKRSDTEGRYTEALALILSRWEVSERWVWTGTGYGDQALMLARDDVQEASPKVVLGVVSRLMYGGILHSDGEKYEANRSGEWYQRLAIATGWIQEIGAILWALVEILEADRAYLQIPEDRVNGLPDDEMRAWLLGKNGR